jgi:hypothetical protein
LQVRGLVAAAHHSGVFDFLKRRGEPSPKEWQTPGLTFLAEQSGPAEDQFKTALSARFSADPRVARAYLVRVAYPKTGPQRSNEENRGPQGSADPVEVLLCLSAPEDVAIVEAVGQEFQKIFDASQHMDTLFLSDAQEQEVSQVARPFYRAAEGRV